MRRSIFTLFFASLLLFSLFGCGGVDRQQAKTDAEAFLDLIEKEDYESAKAFLHPSRDIDLAADFSRIEAEEGIDFSLGIKVNRYTGTSYSWYDSDVDGSQYKFDVELLVGTLPVEAKIAVVENDAGYGIYSFDFDYED